MTHIVKPRNKNRTKTVKADTKQTDPSVLNDYNGDGILPVQEEKPENSAKQREQKAAAPQRKASVPASLPAEKKSERTVTHVVTDAESALIYHANTGPIDWAHEVAMIGDDFELMKDPMALPLECAMMREQCKFAYRWLNPKDQEQFNMQTSGKIRWYVVNRTNSPYIKSVAWDEQGLIRNSGLVLACMPWEMYVKRNQIYRSMAVLPKREGAKDEAGHYSVTRSEEQAKLRSGDIVVSEERAFVDPRNPDQIQTRMVDVNRKWGGDPDQG
jgi:hypothetical protein